MTQALILVDIQNDYFPNGAMELKVATKFTAFRRGKQDHSTL